MHARTRSHGFSILELSIVVVIIGLVVGMGFISMRGVSESAKRAQTEKKLDVIEKALMDFRRIHNRLPCPADITIADHAAGYGTELPNPGTCTGVNYVLLSDTVTDGAPVTFNRVVEGMLPSKALNLPDEYMLDGWGRRIAYAVDLSATDMGAFYRIAPDDRCGIPVDDVTGGTANNRSSGSVYALISYGPNGHGARLPTGGARINGGSTNADEWLNCHCNAAGSDAGGFTNYVQKEAVEGNAATAFDDIIRFKERWQMQTPEDDLRFENKGPDIAVAWQAGGNNYLSTYRHNCGRWQENVILGPATNPGTFVGGVQFTPDNSKLFVYGGNTSVSHCRLYNVNGNSVTLDAVTVFPNCPTYDSGATAVMSNNGYLAISKPTANGVHLWRTANGTFTYLNFISTIATPRSITFSHNAEIMTVGNNSAMQVYQRRADGLGFSLSATQPSSQPATVSAVAVSPDGKYIAAVSSITNSLYIWRVSVGPIYTYVNSYALSGSPHKVIFSSDSRYVMASGSYLLASPGNWNYALGEDGSVTAAAGLLTATSGYIPADKIHGTSADGSVLLLTPHNTHLLESFHRQSSQGYTYRGMLLNTVPANSRSFQTGTLVTSAQVAFRRPDPANP